MIARRDRSFQRIGATLAGVALYVQLVFAGWGMLALAAAGAPIDALDGHALCLAGDAAALQPAAPADGGSSPATPTHDHLAFCCLWHSLPGVAPQARPLPQPVAYAVVVPHGTGDATRLPGPPRGPANARAPPPAV